MEASRLLAFQGVWNFLFRQNMFSQSLSGSQYVFECIMGQTVFSQAIVGQIISSAQYKFGRIFSYNYVSVCVSTKAHVDMHVQYIK